MVITEEIMREKGLEIYKLHGILAKLDFLHGADWARDIYENFLSDLEKLKCCGNCKFYQTMNTSVWVCKNDASPFHNDLSYRHNKKCDKWEAKG